MKFTPATVQFQHFLKVVFKQVSGFHLGKTKNMHLLSGFVIDIL